MMLGNSPQDAAARTFGDGSWAWISEALAGLELDYTNTTGAAFATILIEAAHGDKERLFRYIEAASHDHFQVALHGEWLDVETPFADEQGMAWFIDVIRVIAPEAIKRGLHPMEDCLSLVIDRRRVPRAKSIVIAPCGSGQVRLSTYEQRGDDEMLINGVSQEELLLQIQPVFDLIPKESEYSSWMPTRNNRTLRPTAGDAPL